MMFDDAEHKAKIALVQSSFGPLPETLVELVFAAIGFSNSMAIMPLHPTARQLYAAHNIGGPPALIYAVMIAAALEEEGV